MPGCDDTILRLVRKSGALLILVSGPPRAGKSRIAAGLAAQLPADHFALSDVLKRQTHAHHGLAPTLPVDAFEAGKDVPCPEFGGLSPRQAYIDFSENHLKPRFGSDHLGKIASARVARNRRAGRISIVSGVGFVDEVEPLINAAVAGKTLHLSLRSRPGTVPVADSREALDLSRFGILAASVMVPESR